MSPKKSQGMPINIIIIAAISLIVLVVILMIFSSSFSKTSENIGSCLTKGGICADDSTLGGKGCGGNYPIPLFVSKDCEKTTPKNLCCIKSVGQ